MMRSKPRSRLCFIERREVMAITQTTAGPMLQRRDMHMAAVSYGRGLAAAVLQTPTARLPRVAGMVIEASFTETLG